MAAIIRIEGRNDPLAVYSAQSGSPVEFNEATLERAQAEAAGSGDEVRAAIRARVRQEHPALVGLARSLFDDPEVGFEEHRSVARIAGFLRAGRRGAGGGVRAGHGVPRQPGGPVGATLRAARGI